MTGWNRDGRYHGGFPPHIKRQADKVLPKQCNHCGRTDCKLWLDHIIPAAEGGADSLDNAQWLCTPCHTTKTHTEAMRGRQRRTARGKPTPEPHPGLTGEGGYPPPPKGVTRRG